MTIHLKFTNNKWLVNEKQLSDINHQERLFMDSFFREVKINSMKLENYILNNEHKRV